MKANHHKVLTHASQSICKFYTFEQRAGQRMKANHEKLLSHASQVICKCYTFEQQAGFGFARVHTHMQNTRVDMQSF